MNYPKRLIEVDLPIKQISEYARREKSIRHGHISTLHIWWARRPLAACRAVLCAALWPDPADEQCPQAFRDEAARILCDFAEKVRTDQEVLRLSHSHWSRWRRTNSASLDAKLPQCWPDMRYALLDFIADFANWDASMVPTFLETARALTQAAHEALGGIPGTRPLVVDPFAGGGAIPLEALRVGADAFASDLNPVAVLLNKVVLEYIPKYGQRLADEVRKWGKRIKEQAEQELAIFYPGDPDGGVPLAYLWARTIICEGPGCGAEIPLMRTLWLVKKSSKSVALRIIPNVENKRVDFEIVSNVKSRDVNQGTIRRGSATCPICDYITPVPSIRKQLKGRHGGSSDSRLIAVVTTKSNQQGRFYRLPNEQDYEAINIARVELEKRKQEHHNLLSLVPDELTDQYHSFVNRGPIYGMTSWEDYFLPRQALVLSTIVQYVQEMGSKVKAEYEEGLINATQICLALALDKQADLGNALVRWKQDAECPVNLFARQAIPMVWDFAETAVLSKFSGSWQSMYERTAYAIEQCYYDQPWIGYIERASATSHPLPDDIAHAFITDPPYYYSVQYADLSDFFYIWLRRMLKEVQPDLFETKLTPKDDEIIVQSPSHEFASLGKNNAFYEAHMEIAMSEGQRILAPSGIGVVVFAHTSTSGWEALLQSMINAGWTITGSWPIDTEMSSRVIAQNRSVLASSIHLVCRPRKNTDSSRHINDIGDWRDMLHELPTRIHDWMPRLAKEGVVGADAIFACLGPALEIFSRYSHVERADGEQVTLKEYLEYVWAAVSKEALNMIFRGADTSGFEADARLTAMWLWTLSTSETGITNGQSNGKTEPLEVDDMKDEEEEISHKQVITGYVLEFDAARKIAQGLGANLDKLSSLVEIKGSIARLRSVTERGHFLFDKNTGVLQATKPRKKDSLQQLAMFSMEEQEAELESGKDMPPFSVGNTMLDRLHQAMLLFGAGRSDALKRFITEEGVGRDQRFWRLAQALSSLYPLNSEERRWVEGIQGYKKGFGL